MNFGSSDEVTVRRRRGRWPLKGGGVPWIVGFNFLPVVDAPKEFDEKRNLRETGADCRQENEKMQMDDAVADPAESIRHFGVGIIRAAVGHTPQHPSHALGEHRL